MIAQLDGWDMRLYSRLMAMNKRMTSTTEQLVSLVLANRAEEAIAILEEGNFDKDILNDIFLFAEFGGEDPAPFPLPLYLITQANEVYFGHDDFRDEIMPVVYRNQEGIEKLLQYWKEKGYPVDEPIRFGNYREECAHFIYGDEDDWDYLLDGSLMQLKEKGYDENEVKMCMALLTYDKPEIDRQIAIGTNPDVWISADCRPEDCNSGIGMNGLTTAYDSVSDAQICYNDWHYWESKPGDKLIPPDYNQIRGLFCAAAYEQIIPTLERLAEQAKDRQNV